MLQLKIDSPPRVWGVGWGVTSVIDPVIIAEAQEAIKARPAPLIAAALL